MYSIIQIEKVHEIDTDLFVCEYSTVIYTSKYYVMARHKYIKLCLENCDDNIYYKLINNRGKIIPIKEVQYD